MENFDELWRALAAGGFCDAVGSYEYHRVRNAWFDSGYLMALHDFIIKKANEPPPPPPPPPTSPA